MQTTNNQNQKQNKGFTVFVGDTYVGYLTLGEKNVKPDVIAAMQQPENMKAILASAELRPYAEPVDADTSAIESIIAAVPTPTTEGNQASDS